MGDSIIAPNRYIIDTSIALEHIALAATAEGLGSCWVCSFSEEKAKELLNLPEGQKPVAIMALGYPKKSLNITRIITRLIRPSKGIEDLVSDGDFGTKWKGGEQ